MNIDRILTAKNEIDRIKITKAKAEGELESLLATLKNTHGINSLSDAKSKLVELYKGASILEREMEENLVELERELYDKSTSI